VKTNGRFIARLQSSDSGQVLPIMAFMMLIFLGVAALAVDGGRAMYASRALQQSTDAAALAGAQAMSSASTTSAVTSAATLYSAVAGNMNASAMLSNVSMVAGYPQVKCLTTLTAQGMACVSPLNGNAVQVQQQAVLKMYFAGLLGHPTMTLGATSTAAMNGSSGVPSNVVLIVDTTASMNDEDSDSQCKTTRIACALSGVQVLLQTLSPCGSGLATCGTVTNGNVSKPVDKVSLFTFPAVANAASAADDYNCSGKAPTITPYSYPTLPMYQITSSASDYRSSDSTTTLSPTSNIVVAAGGKSGCSGMQAPGGEGTYYAGVITAAQQQLVASSQTGVQNVMILLSDGDSNVTSSHISGTTCSKTVTTSCWTTTGAYPSLIDQCQQAVTAAQAATAAGTLVYSVAYGSTSSGCSTDTSTITPCQTMQKIASAPQYFYSDYTASAGDGTCISAAHSTANLNQIFTQIAGGLTVARLIPNGTT
jgi:Flp pilus assembly protein TadG